MSKAHSPWAIGISHAQRMAIKLDPKWNDGNYEKGEGPVEGLATARMMAMITYRTPVDYESKFGRDLQNGKELYQVESYLNYQGDKLAGRFDAHSYLNLTEAMDSHDVSRDRGSFSEVLQNVQVPIKVGGIDSDHLHPTHEQKVLTALLGNATYSEIRSTYGHDAFLIECEQLNSIFHSFLEKKDKKIIISEL